MTSELQAALIGGAVAALVSGIIALITSIVTCILSNRAEERRMIAQVALSAGMKEYEYMREIANEKKLCIATPRYWIYHMIISLNRLLRINTSKPKEVEKALQKDKNTTELLAKYLATSITRDLTT